MDDVDGFNFGMTHFERIGGNKSGLDHNALIGNGRLARPVSNEQCDKQSPDSLQRHKGDPVQFRFVNDMLTSDQIAVDIAAHVNFLPCRPDGFLLNTSLICFRLVAFARFPEPSPANTA